MNSNTVNQQGSHNVKDNGFWRIAAGLYHALCNAASDILLGASVLACVVLAVALLSSCSDDKDAPTPGDTTAPVIKVVNLSVDISWGKQVKVKDNELYVGDVLVASWTDNVTKKCKVELTLNSKPVA